MKSADKVYDIIREKILSGDLAQGAPLREEEVAEMCGVSRTPVRDAIRRLEAEMFVQRTESQRTFVADWSLADIEEVFTLRGMLEGHAARRAAERADPEAIARLVEINARARDALQYSSTPIEDFLSGNREYHALLIEMAASDRLATLLNRLILQPIVQRTALRYDAAQIARSLSEHEELVDALRVGDADWAQAVMTAHIRRAHHIYVARYQDEES